MNGPTRSRRPVDEYYLSLLASKNTVVPSLPSKARNSLSPPLIATYNAYPNQGPGFYRYVERDSRRRNYYLGRPRWSTNKPWSTNSPPTTEAKRDTTAA